MRVVTAEQPDTPAYFSYDAALNAKERPTLGQALEQDAVTGALPARRILIAFPTAGGEMTNGYAKPVLVTTGWPADRLDEPELVIAEVDENADLYDEGHIPGAVKLHWRDDLHDAVERDIVDRETCEGVLGDRGIGNDAVSIPWASAVGDDGTFKGADELRELYGDKGVTPEQEVTYCRIGERWAHTWFVVRELLGYESVRNHDGSWTEWGNLVDVPIERGA